VRLDRLATLYLAHPLRKLSPVSDIGRLRILMYHRISAAAEPNFGPYFRVNTSPARFSEHMQFLHEERYKVIDLLQGIALLKAGSFSRKHVVITFDDGYADFAEHAFPALAKHAFTATVFLPTAFIGQDRKSFKETLCLSWPDVKSLRKSGIRFGSHTVSHPKLRDMNWAGIETELTNSKKTLEEQLNEPITTFAYPYAFPETDTEFVRTFSALLIRIGYDCCVTTRIGLARSGDDLHTLKRLPVNDCDDILLFRAKLEGSYDWLALPQWFRKLSRACRVESATTIASQGRTLVNPL
jgi:peptidoglycan/xylan/chitin deacetylase (PgdA/CDA1 family)